MNWFQRLFYPEDLQCKSCEILQQQLEIERARFNILLSRLASAHTVKEELESSEPEEMRPIPTGKRKFVPFAVRQQMMEANDAKTLEVLKGKWNEIHAVQTVTEPRNPTENTTEKSNDELEQEILSGAGSN